MARKPMMAGNWKMNNTIAEAVVLTQEISNQYDKETWGEDVDIVICPPYVDLKPAKTVLDFDKTKVAVNAHDDGDVLVLGRRGDDDLLGARVKVRLGLRAVGEEAGGLDDDVDAQLAPGEVGGLALGEHLDRMAVGHEAVLGDLDRVEGAPVDGIVLEQVGHRRNVAEVVHCHNLDLGIVHHRAERQAADATESVNAYFDCHAYPLSDTRTKNCRNAPIIAVAAQMLQALSGSRIKKATEQAIHRSFTPLAEGLRTRCAPYSSALLPASASSPDPSVSHSRRLR